MSDRRVKLPYKDWLPRPHQMALWQYLENGGDRAVAIWHRRAGKDEVCLHHTMMSLWKRPANYWHCLPEYAMARKAIWDAINPHTGLRRIDEAFPHLLRESTRDHDMTIKFKNGSTWSCIGADSYDRTVGSSAAGIVYSEWALSNPSAWAYHSPMIAENNGWAIFISTPRGHNHAKTMYDHALQQPRWFAERLSAEDTHTMTRAALDDALSEMQALYGYDHGTAQFRQEYLCDWASALLGSFYAHECSEVRDEGRIMECEALPGIPVHRAWDLGVRDDTSIWWYQPQPSGQILILDHLATSGVGVEWWRDQVYDRIDKYGWTQGVDYVPHDANVKEFGTGRTRVETMKKLGLNPDPIPNATISDGINAVRRIMPLCIFHPRTETSGFAALEQYRREWDDEKKAYRASAVHDWTSHPADAFRYLAMGYKAAPLRVIKPPPMEGWRIPPPDDTTRRGIRL